MLHVTGYGRGGPKSDRPGYGTLAEAMSGFAHVTGQPDGPPTLPPFMLADGVASLAATYAVMMALYHRDARGGEGQLVDVNLIEPLARLIESSTLGVDQLGVGPGRVGNRLDASAPRNAYRTADGRWLAISERVAEHRRPDLQGDRPARPGRRPRLRRPRSAAGAGGRGRRPGGAVGRGAHAGRGHGHLRGGRGRGRPGVRRARSCWPTSTCGPGARFVTVDDPDFGPTTVQAPVARLTATPGRVEHLGRALGRRQRRRLPRPARARPRPPGRPAGRRRDLKEDRCPAPARAPLPAVRAGDAGQQRAHVREGRPLGRRPGLPRPGGRLRARRQGGRQGDRGGGADRARLGRHGPGRAHQRARHPVVPRRRHRGRHRRPRRARRADRAQGAHGPGRLVGRRPAHAAGGQARPRPADRAGGAGRGVRGPGQRGRDRPVERRAWRRSSSAPATCPRRSGPGSTATSTPPATTRATSGTSPGSRW